MPHNDAPELTVGEIAAIHEFGTPTIPARSWLRGFVDENLNEIRNMEKYFAQLVVLGSLTPLKASKLFGRWLAQDMRARIERGIAPPLAQTTIDRRVDRGFPPAPALVVTRQLINSIVSEVIR